MGKLPFVCAKFSFICVEATAGVPFLEMKFKFKILPILFFQK